MSVTKFLGGFFAMLLLLFAAAGSVFAQEIREKEIVILPEGEEVFRDYFAAAETVRVAGTINGDAYLAGGNVVLEGTINGDLIAAGGNVTVLGTVSDDVRVAGGNITISGTVGKNITALGGSVSIPSETSVAGSLTTAGGTVDVFAPIGKGIRAGVGKLTIGSSVGGDVKAGVGQIVLTPDATISGNLTYWSDEPSVSAFDDQVTGDVVFKRVETEKKGAETRKSIVERATGAAVFFQIVGFISALVVGLLLLHFAPKFTQDASDRVRGAFWQSLLTGFIALIVVPVAVVILLVTLIGIPIGLLLLVLYSVILYFAKIIVAITVGKAIQKQMGWKISVGWALFFGLFLYSVITFIPVVGWIVWLLVLTIGFGAILIQKKALYDSLKAKHAL